MITFTFVIDLHKFDASVGVILRIFLEKIVSFGYLKNIRIKAYVVVVVQRLDTSVGHFLEFLITIQHWLI